MPAREEMKDAAPSRGAAKAAPASPRASKRLEREVERLTLELVAAKHEVRDEVERLTHELVEARLALATSDYEREQAEAACRRATAERGRLESAYRREAEHSEALEEAASRERADADAVDALRGELVAAKLALAQNEFEREGERAWLRTQHSSEIAALTRELAEAQARIAELTVLPPLPPSASPLSSVSASPPFRQNSTLISDSWRPV